MLLLAFLLAALAPVHGIAGCYGGGLCANANGCCDCAVPQNTCEAEGATYLDDGCDGLCAEGTAPDPNAEASPPPPLPPPAPKPPPPAQCNFPGNDGYYIEGVNGIVTPTSNDAVAGIVVAGLARFGPGGPLPGPEGCYDVSIHKCDCSKTEAECTAAGDPHLSWTAGCTSCVPFSDGPEGCYDVTEHKCDCSIAEADCAAPFVWTPGCDSCLSNGKLEVSSTWALNQSYPTGQNVICEGPFCSETCKTEGCPSYLSAATCAKLRFTYAGDTTVFKMKDQEAFASCDFADATLLSAASATETTFDYDIDEDVALDTVLYFASQAECADNVKVAVKVETDYHQNFAQCYAMGVGSPRIKHCDCYHSLKPTSLVDPCFTAFVMGCVDDMPDDLSCCPGEGASYDAVSGEYTDGGTCVPKSVAGNTPPQDDDDDGDGLSGGEIAGIAIGAIILGIAGGTLAYLGCKAMERRRAASAEPVTKEYA